MKKILYTAAVLFALSFAVSSCTEENVKPSDTTPTVGGGVSEDPIKK